MFDKFMFQHWLDLSLFNVCSTRINQTKVFFCYSCVDLANHHPLVAVLKPGVVSVVESDGNTKRIFGMFTFPSVQHRPALSFNLLNRFLFLMIINRRLNSKLNDETMIKFECLRTKSFKFLIDLIRLK